MTETTDIFRVYDVTDDHYLRVERLRRTEYNSGVTVDQDVGVADLAALAAFPDAVPSIDLTNADEATVAFAEELVA